MQSLRYNFRAVRAIISCIHSSWNTCYFETASDSNEFAKQLFVRSERLETTESIKAHQQNPSSYQVETEKTLVRESETIEDVRNVKKITAYDRIKNDNDDNKQHVNSDSESEESEESSGESEDSEVDQKETKSKWGLVRSVFKFGLLSGGKSKLIKRSVEDSENSNEQENTSEMDEQNEDPDANSAGEEERSGEEEDDDEDDNEDEEENSTDRHSKGNKYTFKLLLQKLSLK
jgi:hypothetical protein